jgi:hypothetical protein
MSEVKMVYVDQGVNLKKLRALQRKGGIKLVQADSLEQQFKGVDKQGRAFTIGQSQIGGSDMIADDNVDVVAAFMGKQNNIDFNHIYAAYLSHCDYFVTNNPKDFIHKGKRAELESMLGLKIRTSDEFLTEEGE